MDKFLFKIEHPENTNTNWDNFYLIKGNKIQTIEKVNIHNIFETFKLFLSEYLIAETRAKFTSLVRLLHIEDLFDKAFLRALNNKTLKIPLIGHPEKMILKQHFAPLLIPEDALELADTTALNANITINNNHLNAIKTAFEITNASPEQQAQTLLTISGVFAKYSSSNFFGTELDSPDELRRYALALLNKASELCSHLVPQETLLSWRYRFLGINEAFSCTAILSDMILEYCIKNFRNLAQTIIPPTWC